ncbi:MAG: iron-containing alcohol dehydrogenase [Blastocatellia bacterium]|nr:iron-containing alcohol dehydrogenase [Blastocatellia bacterium]
MGWINGNHPISRPDILFFMPTEIKFGFGKLQSLPTEFQIAPDLSQTTHAMLITDKGVAAAGLAEKVKQAFAESDYEIRVVYDETPAESDVNAVKQAARLAAEHDINLFLALGGGSVMDTAKAVSILATYGGEPGDYEGGFMVPGPIKPVVAIPTTVGTGSEVTLVSMVKDAESHRKLLISSPFLYPRAAVLDPEMVATLPGKLVAWTGMDALTHSIEAYTCTEHEPISEALAFRATEMIADNLEKAVIEAGPTEARAKMQLAATMAGIAFTNSPVGAVHAIAHAVGALYHVHHGLANAIALPFVMEYNLSECATGYAALAKAMNVAENGSEEALAKACIAAVRNLKSRTDVPTHYSQVGVPKTEEAAQKITQAAMEELCLAFNPRKGTEEELLELVRQTL